MSYVPRPSSLSDPWICVSFVSRRMLADLIDVSQHLDCTLDVKEFHKFGRPRIGRRSDADEWHVGSPGAARVVHGVTHVQKFLFGPKRGDLQQAIGGGFLVRDVVG